MKRYRIWVLSALFFAGSQAAMADSFSLNRFPSRVLPVLVRVDAHGRVTDVSPSTELTPRFRRLLRQNIGEMIKQPANLHGRPVASQFVMQLAMQTTPRDDGRYDARFAYVSSSPVPPGQWFWQHEDGHRLVLVSRDGWQQQRRLDDGRQRPGREARPFARSFSQPARAVAAPMPSARRAGNAGH